MLTLSELAEYIRNTVPSPQALLQVRILQNAQGVTFIWHGTEFFVRPSLQSLEVRGNTLYITGLSTLLEHVLVRRKQEEKRFTPVVQMLSESEVMIKDPRLVKRGIEMLRKVQDELKDVPSEGALFHLPS